jgi:hypothetical protein
VPTLHSNIIGLVGGMSRIKMWEYNLEVHIVAL